MDSTSLPCGSVPVRLDLMWVFVVVVIEQCTESTDVDGLTFDFGSFSSVMLWLFGEPLYCGRNIGGFFWYQLFYFWEVSVRTSQF